MGLIDRISVVTAAAFERSLRDMSDESKRISDIRVSRADTTRVHIEQVARQLECELVNIGTLRGGSYHIVGELVLCVREQPHIEQGKDQVTDRREVLWQHFVYLVGLAPDGRLVYTKIGVLALLGFEGIMAAYNGSRAKTFDEELVRAALILDNN